MIPGERTGHTKRCICPKKARVVGCGSVALLRCNSDDVKGSTSLDSYYLQADVIEYLGHKRCVEHMVVQAAILMVTERAVAKLDHTPG